eukprot:16434332-Heterocapsa_arctica.AAC.1
MWSATWGTTTDSWRTRTMRTRTRSRRTWAVDAYRRVHRGEVVKEPARLTNNVIEWVIEMYDMEKVQPRAADDAHDGGRCSGCCARRGVW